MSAPDAPRFPLLVVDVPAGRADDLAYELMTLGAAGVEIRDDHTFVTGPGGGGVRLVASFDSRSAAEEARDALSASEPGLSPSVDELVGDAWRDAYKDHFKPFALTDRLTVAPPWERYEPRSDELVLELDPGRAFGTGLHDTTALVAEQLDARSDELAGATLLDVGTGSGILALAALILGADRAVAVDNDPEVIEVAEQNARRCGLAERLWVDTTPVEEVPGRYPFVVANIRATILLGMAEALRDRLTDGGWLVLSGVLVSEQDEVTKGFLAIGLEHVETRRRGEGEEGWVAIVLRRTS